MTLPVDVNPWGVCQAKECKELTLRCQHGRCKQHCKEQCVDSTGVKTHYERSAQETNHLTPSYHPTQPTLVAVTKLRGA